MDDPKDNLPQDQNDLWFPKATSIAEEKDWFPNTPTSKITKWKILMALIDEFLILILILGLVYYYLL